MPKTIKEEFSVSGEKLLEKIKAIIREGNARRIIIKGESGETFMELPVTIGAIGILIAPLAAAIGAAAALMTKCTIVVEKKVKN